MSAYLRLILFALPTQFFICFSVSFLLIFSIMWISHAFYWGYIEHSSAKSIEIVGRFEIESVKLYLCDPLVMKTEEMTLNWMKLCSTTTATSLLRGATNLMFFL